MKPSPIDQHTAPPTLDYAGPTTPKWVVGTLAYTTAGLIGIFVWLLLGDFAWNMKDKAIGPLCQIMLRSFDAPVWLVGLLIGSIPAGIGLLLGPIVGVISDRHRGRWGRRIPFILGAVPFIVLMMLGLAAAPDLGAWLQHRLQQRYGPGAPSLQVCRIGVFTLFWSMGDIATVVANSLYGALVNDLVPQAVIGRFYGLFRCIGLAAGIIFNYWLMGQADAHSKLLLAGLGLLYGVCFIVMCLKVKEGKYPPPPAQLGIQSTSQRMGTVLSYLKECYGNPFFLSFFLATTLGGLALAPVNTFAVYQAQSVHMDMKMYGKCIALSYAVSLTLAYPLGNLADRFHPLRLGLTCMILYAAATAFGFFFAFTAKTFFVALALHTVVSGAHITGTASIAQRLLPRNKFAEISAAGGVIGSITGLFVSPALGLFIQWMGMDYRYVFPLASVLAVLTAASYLLLLREYNARGGDESFVPPEEDGLAVSRS